MGGGGGSGVEASRRLVGVARGDVTKERGDGEEGELSELGERRRSKRSGKNERVSSRSDVPEGRPEKAGSFFAGRD